MRPKSFASIFLMMLLAYGTLGWADSITKTDELVLGRIVAEPEGSTELIAEIKMARSWTAHGSETGGDRRGLRSNWKTEAVEDRIVATESKPSALIFSSSTDRFPILVEGGAFAVDESLNVIDAHSHACNRYREMSMPDMCGSWDGKKSGAIHRLLGKIKMFDYEFDSNTDDPLVFKVTGSGYLYLSGTGSVKDLKTGKTYLLKR
jgi:hypothetical protein